MAITTNQIQNAKTDSQNNQGISLARKTMFAWVATLAMLFSFATPSFAAAPTITSFTPEKGLAGISVVITGIGFTNPSNVTAVKFGTVTAVFTVSSDTEIRTTVPAGTGQVEISVTNADGTVTSATKFSYAPTVTTLTPTTGPVGGTNEVVITGTNFISVTAVRFGDTPATSYSVVSPTEIKAVAPAKAAGTYSVVVAAAGGESAPKSGYVYVKSPATISSIAPKTGLLTGGTSVVITGTNFHGVTGAAAVKFGSTNATSYVVNSTTQITAVAPAGGAGVVSISVVSVDGTATLGAAYTYAAVSTIISTEERVFFKAGSSNLRESQFAEIFAIAAAVKDKKEIKITLTSKRWAAESLSLGKARTTWVVKALKLAGVNATAIYTRVHKVGTAGTRSSKKNNRVIIEASWTN